MMRPILSCCAAILVLAMAAPLDAKPGRGNGNGNGHGNGNGRHAVAAERGAPDCPPGLARRNPPCIPPGQVGRSREDAEERQEEVASEQNSQGPSMEEVAEAIWPVLVALRPVSRPYLLEDSSISDTSEPEADSLAMAPAAISPEPVSTEVPDPAPEPMASLDPSPVSTLEPVTDEVEETAAVAPAASHSSDLQAVFEAAEATGEIGF